MIVVAEVGPIGADRGLGVVVAIGAGVVGPVMEQGGVNERRGDHEREDHEHQGSQGQLLGPPGLPSTCSMSVHNIFHEREFD